MIAMMFVVVVVGVGRRVVVDVAMSLVLLSLLLPSKHMCWKCLLSTFLSNLWLYKIWMRLDHKMCFA